MVITSDLLCYTLVFKYKVLVIQPGQRSHAAYDYSLTNIIINCLIKLIFKLGLPGF